MFTVRELNKNGGRKYVSMSDAIAAAFNWFWDTGIGVEVLDPFGQVRFKLWRGMGAER